MNTILIALVAVLGIAVIALSAALFHYGVHRPAQRNVTRARRILFPYVANALSSRALDAALRLAHAEDATLAADLPRTRPAASSARRLTATPIARSRSHCRRRSSTAQSSSACRSTPASSADAPTATRSGRQSPTSALTGSSSQRPLKAATASTPTPSRGCSTMPPARSSSCVPTRTSSSAPHALTAGDTAPSRLVTVMRTHPAPQPRTDTLRAPPRPRATASGTRASTPKSAPHGSGWRGAPTAAPTAKAS